MFYLYRSSFKYKRGEAWIGRTSVTGTDVSSDLLIKRISVPCFEGGLYWKGQLRELLFFMSHYIFEARFRGTNKIYN